MWIVEFCLIANTIDGISTAAAKALRRVAASGPSKGSHDLCRDDQLPNSTRSICNKGKLSLFRIDCDTLRSVEFRIRTFTVSEAF